MKKYRSKFEAWIYTDAGGPLKFAKRLGVHRSAVGFWVQRKQTPRLAVALKIEKMAKGKLTLAEILSGTCPV